MAGHALFLILQVLGAAVAPVLVPAPGAPPFSAGEVLTYDARVSVLGRVGQARLSVADACNFGDRPVLLLSFDVNGGASFLRVNDATRSWIDAGTLATLRYEKRESSPLGSHEESVTVDPGEGRWTDASGAVSETADPLPLDELSLLYFIRTLPLRTGDTELGAGHFDPRRNPVGFEVRGRSEVEVPAGRFAVIDIELKVRDPRRYRGTGSIRVLLSDDERRIPVRIKTSLPGSTAVTLELRSGTALTPASAPECP